MLYLAEVHKKNGFMGTKTELKLVARKQSENDWNPIAREEFIAADAANDFNAGVLVLVELDSNQTPTSVQDATRQLVSILKNFSRMRDRFRTQEEEIEGWKQSLIYQSQELTRREVDMEARAEELQELEAEAQRIEQQRQEFEATRDQILQLKEQIEQDRQQLEEGWGRLQVAQREAQPGLSDQQVHQIEALLTQLDGAFVNELGQPETILSRIEQQQSQLAGFWQTLEQDRHQAQEQQTAFEGAEAELKSSWQFWHQNQESLAQAKLELRLQEQTLSLQTDRQRFLNEQLQSQSRIYGSLRELKGDTKNRLVDLRSLRNMPIEELDQTVEKLNQELVKLSSFVNDQEEELTYQKQTIETLETNIRNASEYDRLSLTGELEDERQHFRLLDETLEGQRQTLKEKEAVLYLHQDVLHQRKRSQKINSIKPPA